MKKFTRIASLLLVLVMVLGLAATAFAEEDQQFTLTIDTHYTTQAFDVYQIFAGYVVVNEDGDREISDVTWGANVTEEGKIALLTFDDNTFASVGELIKYLSDNRTTDEEIAVRFVEFAEQYLTENYTARLTYVEGTGYQATLPGGYYLIKNPDEIDYGILASDLMLYVLGNMTISPKVPGPKIWKVVYNNNDSIDPQIKSVKVGDDYVGISTWDIGDDARFMLNGTIPADIAAYTSYKYEFHDQWAEGLFAPVAAEDIEVYISSQTKYTVIDASFYEYVATENGFVVKVNLAAVYKKYVIEEGDQIFNDGHSAKNILVKYSTELLNPTMGAHLNTNTAWIEYQDGETEKTTTWTGTVDFTVFKYDEEGDPLSGAEFQLQKFMRDDKNGTETVSITHNGETKTYTGKWVVFCEEMELTQDNSDVVSYYAKGLDEGIYKLVETNAPAGYKFADDLIFKVSTAENYDLGYISQILVYDDKGESGAFSYEARTYTTSKGDIQDVTGFTVGVVNVRDGLVLPETGGMGTTLFYVLGAVLVLGAAVLLITKRRMNTEN